MGFILLAALIGLAAVRNRRLPSPVLVFDIIGWTRSGQMLFSSRNQGFRARIKVFVQESVSGATLLKWGMIDHPYRKNAHHGTGSDAGDSPAMMQSGRHRASSATTAMNPSGSGSYR
jgi:hypothetical protein